jgi:hypothetical protein
MIMNETPCFVADRASLFSMMGDATDGPGQAYSPAVGSQFAPLSNGAAQSALAEATMALAAKDTRRFENRRLRCSEFS